MGVMSSLDHTLVSEFGNPHEQVFMDPKGKEHTHTHKQTLQLEASRNT